MKFLSFVPRHVQWTLSKDVSSAVLESLIINMGCPVLALNYVAFLETSYCTVHNQACMQHKECSELPKYALEPESWLYFWLNLFKRNYILHELMSATLEEWIAYQNQVTAIVALSGGVTLQNGWFLGRLNAASSMAGETCRSHTGKEGQITEDVVYLWNLVEKGDNQKN